ncbi:MAG: ferritin-like domain-containing protein [Alphaproteobacteria bacterium]|nr:ferritin-like domain-containing protein [Alphaproteobacteria bacterium]
MRDLRLRFWLALGLPLAALPHGASAKECREALVCGGVSSPESKGVCGPSGDHLRSYGRMEGLTATWSSHNPVLAGLKLDDKATRAYRETLSGGLDPSDYCCYSGCAPEVEALAPTPRCEAGEVGVFVCGSTAPPGEKGVCTESASSLRFVGLERVVTYGPDYPGSLHLDEPMTAAFRAAIAPRSEPERLCCYSACQAGPPVVVDPKEVPFEPQPNRGRPFRVADDARTAPEVGSDAWTADLDVAPVDLVLRPMLAEAWIAEARMEHASVAAFARLGLQLVALGAPWELVDAAHFAARDEIRHARVAFSLATQIGGEAVGPGPFPEAAGEVDLDLERFVRHTLIDGCIGEAVASEEAARAASAAVDPGLAEILWGIASDEASHAELGWRVLGWMRERHPEIVGRVVREVYGRVLSEPSVQADAECCARSTRAHGLLCTHERAAARSAVLDQVVLPILAAAAANPA